MRPLALILAGGAARRMGGGDKTRLVVGGRPVLHRIIDTLAPQCDGVAISGAAHDGTPWPVSPEFVLPDPVSGRPGPLAGVLAGLLHLERLGYSDRLLLTVPGDAPFLPADLVVRLLGARVQAGSATAVAASGGRLHHVTALWPVALRPELQAYVAAGHRGVGIFHERAGATAAVWPDTPVDPFFNLNTPADVITADRLAWTFGL